MIPTVHPHPEPPRPSVREMQLRLAGELSLRGRLAYALLLLFALGTAIVTGALALGEPGLPARTRIAFWTLTALALLWASLFAWTLLRRKVLLARQKLATSRLAVLASALFTGGSLALALSDAGLRRSGLLAAALGALLLALALWLWRRAGRRYRLLLERTRRLERELGSGG